MNNSMNFQSVHSNPFDEALERVRKARIDASKAENDSDLPPPGVQCIDSFLTKE